MYYTGKKKAKKIRRKMLTGVLLEIILPTMKRGAVTKRSADPVSIWFPLPLREQLDVGVIMTDLDRSKFIRAAVREKLARLNFQPPAPR